MNDVSVFRPARRAGLVLHAAALGFCLIAGVWGLWQAFQVNIGLPFLSYFFLSLIAFSLVPVLAYRAYALFKANYIIERDGIRLNWGLRAEDIPLDTLLWVCPVEETRQPPPGELRREDIPFLPALPLPRLRWPGAVLGLRTLPDGTSIEFFASSSAGLILIATPGRVYAVSPSDPVEFLHAYRRLAEFGSLTPLPARSVYPTFLLARVWNARPARYLLLLGLVLSLALFIWVSLSVPNMEQISLGFNPDGTLRDPVPGVQLLLLPLVSGFFYLTDLLLGLYFYRKSEGQAGALPFSSHLSLTWGQMLAYLLWGTGAFTPLLFLLALSFILGAQ